MPPLTPLALRYLVWLIGLRILYIAAVSFLGLPNTLATTVILASVPAMDIGLQAVRKATRALAARDWATIWALLISIYLIINVIVPAMLVPAFRQIMNDPVGLRSLVLVNLSAGLMLALFLWIGSRIGARRQG